MFSNKLDRPDNPNSIQHHPVPAGYGIEEMLVERGAAGYPSD
jgi:hypothetical protein